jgi:hypothetical protein
VLAAEPDAVLVRTLVKQPGAAGCFGQSFVPRTAKLRAIAVQAYPISTADGWLSLDLRADKSGRPDNNVIVRSWLRITKRCAPHSSFSVFPLPDTELALEKTYWFTVTEHPDPNQSGHGLTNHRFDPADNNNGHQIHGGGSTGGRANYFLVTDGQPPSWLREATEDERKAVPAPPASAFEWWKRGDSSDPLPTENDG